MGAGALFVQLVCEFDSVLDIYDGNSGPSRSSRHSCCYIVRLGIVPGKKKSDSEIHTDVIVTSARLKHDFGRPKILVDRSQQKKYAPKGAFDFVGAVRLQAVSNL